MIRRAEPADLDQLTALTIALWPDCDPEERWNDMADLLASSEAAIFLLMDGETAVGFAQCQLRHDYVEGTDSSPVGYLEGIYVDEAHRGRGGAKALLKSCERWAASWGCTEFASDCELTNTDSLAFHLKAGFTEANRIICFTKKL